MRPLVILSECAAKPTLLTSHLCVLSCRELKELSRLLSLYTSRRGQWPLAIPSHKVTALQISRVVVVVYKGSCYRDRCYEQKRPQCRCTRRRTEYLSYKSLLKDGGGGGGENKWPVSSVCRVMPACCNGALMMSLLPTRGDVYALSTTISVVRGYLARHSPVVECGRPFTPTGRRLHCDWHAPPRARIEAADGKCRRRL